MKLPALGVAIVLLVGPAVAVADDLEDAIQSLKDAAAKKDAESVKKLAATIHPMTGEIVAEAAPQGADEKKVWEERVAYAKSSQVYVESASRRHCGPVPARGDGGPDLDARATEPEEQVPGCGVRAVSGGVGQDRGKGEDSRRRRKGPGELPRK